MRLLAAIAFVAIAAICCPALAQPVPAGQASCARLAAGKPMLACLLDGAETLLNGPSAPKDPEASGVLWQWLNQVAADSGDLERARRSAGRIADPGEGRMAQARLGALLLRQGDRKGAVAVLDALLAAPPSANARQVDWAAADLLVALGDPARTRAYLDGLPPDRQVNALLALVRAQQQAKRMDRAEQLLSDFGDKGSSASVPIIIHSQTALAFIVAGRLDAARRMGRLLPDSDRLRMEARVALKQDQLGKRQEARKAPDALLAAAPRSSDTRLAGALLAARHGDFAAAQAQFPSALSYDSEALEELLGLLARAGETERATAIIATMNNGKDRAAAFARMAILLAKANKAADAAPFLARARAILDPLVALKHGAAPQLMDFGRALRSAVEAMLALGQVDAARAFVNRLEAAVQTDPYGLDRPGVMAGLTGVNEALFGALLARGEPAGVRQAITARWRATAARNAFLEAGMVKEAVQVAERQNPDMVAKTGDFLAVAQYIAKH
jgi:hypothetical protein